MKRRAAIVTAILLAAAGGIWVARRFLSPLSPLPGIVPERKAAVSPNGAVEDSDRRNEGRGSDLPEDQVDGLDPRVRGDDEVAIKPVKPVAPPGTVAPAKAGAASRNGPLDESRGGNEAHESDPPVKPVEDLDPPVRGDDGAKAPAPEEIIPETPETAEAKARAEGRRQRGTFPIGVILVDETPASRSANSRDPLYRFTTGDFVRVIERGPGAQRVRVHPGLDVYLAATSRDVKPAGERLPDLPGWVDADSVYVFETDQAKDFLETVEPVTLGHDPNFSTLAFYERAMKNPDPVVHRVIAPRFMAILGIHEDYQGSWGTLIRDRDPKIRSLALSEMRQRGVGNSRPIIEDLIVRVQQLTRTRARGVREAEVMAILDILRDSGHPRVKAALQGFVDDWKGTQGEALNQALAEIVKN